MSAPAALYQVLARYGREPHQVMRVSVTRHASKAAALAHARTGVVSVMVGADRWHVRARATAEETHRALMQATTALRATWSEAAA